VTEDELIQRCREGERQAQRALFEHTSGAVYRLLLRLCGNPDDAFDLTQETYIKAFAAFPGFDGRSSLKTWLFRIGVNEALQLHRRSRVFKRKLERLASETTQKWEPIGPLACRIDVKEALNGLDPSDRAILLLRYHEGLDYRSIAETAGIAEGTVASRLNRARQRLRVLLNGGYGREDEASHVHLIKRQEHELA
jgi:RNA polymerase sigma-70 factor (ECF subfamily)